MKIIITSQGATGSRTLAKALAKLSEKNAVVHGHFSVSSLYNDFNWKKSPLLIIYAIVLVRNIAQTFGLKCAL